MLWISFVDISITWLPYLRIIPCCQREIMDWDLLKNDRIKMIFHSNKTALSILLNLFGNIALPFCAWSSIASQDRSDQPPSRKWEDHFRHQNVQESLKVILLPWAALVDNHQSCRSTQCLARVILLDRLWVRGGAETDRPGECPPAMLHFPPMTMAVFKSNFCNPVKAVLSVLSHLLF